LGQTVNILKGGDPRASIRRIHPARASLSSARSSWAWTATPPALGADRQGANHYGVDPASTQSFSPLPGTRLWTRRKPRPHAAKRFPQDVALLHAEFSVARYQNLSWASFWGRWRIVGEPSTRVADAATIVGHLSRWRSPLTMLVAICRTGGTSTGRTYCGPELSRGAVVGAGRRCRSEQNCRRGAPEVFVELYVYESDAWIARGLIAGSIASVFVSRRGNDPYA